MMFRLNVPTKRDSVLNGVLFRQEEKRKGQLSFRKKPAHTQSAAR